jgi:hypothetical protein
MVLVYARRLVRPSAPAVSAQVAQPSTQLQLPHSEGPRQAQRQRLAELKWSRDPFTLGSTGGEIGSLALSGILWDATQPIAIINGSMVQVGEEVDGYRIVEISQDHVSLSDGAETFQLRIAP